MKVNYTTLKAIAVTICMASVQLSAQLSGTVTIDQSAMASATNYTSFTAFAADINNVGISGPLVVNVVSGTGPYNEQVTFNQITGTSATDRVTINGNNNLVTFNSSNFSQPWVIRMNGADYFSVSNLNVQGTGTYAYCLMLNNNSNYNMFAGCTFSVPANNTSTGQIPIVISGSGTSYSSFGAGGNFNIFQNCSTFSGYFGVTVYGNSTAPYTRGNQFLNCAIRDFYAYGLYVYAYNDGTIIRNNLIECPTRTNNTTKAGVYAYGTQNTLIEGNWIRGLFNSNTINSTSTCYGIFCYYNLQSSYLYQQLPSQNRNIIRNNIVSDITHNGAVYGIRGDYYDGEIYNNTISLDYAGATGGTTYGIYVYAYQNNYVSHTTNNIVTITRGGTGTKYCYFNGSYSTGTDLTADRNDFYINSPGGTNYIGSHTGAVMTLGALQSQGIMATGFSVDPMYANASAMDYHPTNASINNTAVPMGLYVDQQNMPRSGSTPDIGALEFLSMSCAGTPSANGVSVPAGMICPGESVSLGLLNYYSDTGITYQWQSSTTSSVGPFTAVSGATNVTHTTPGLTGPVWYSVVMTCTNGMGSISPVAYVDVAGTSYSTVPYFEDFESITKANKLPNCSWMATNLGGASATYTSAANQNRVPRSGSRFASFYYSPSGSNQFFTNAIWMNAGVTYSASVWYTTEYYGYNNWSNLAIMVGPNQSATGQSVVATTGGPALSNVYKALSNTFTVAASGWYYVGIKATSSGGCCAYYLSWDDLKIEVPCDLPGNSPNLTVAASATSICQGDPVTLTATGADTYQWNTGATTAIITETPSQTTNYSVQGLDTLSGCPVMMSVLVNVKPTPQINVFANPPVACAGSPVSLNAFGASTYSWNSGGFGNITTVIPSSSTTYSVMGSNAQGCTGVGSIALTVNQLPIVNGIADRTDICRGESVSLQASGAASYQWSSVSSFYNTNPIVVSPQVSTTYSIVGTDANGCKGTAMLTISVDECSALNKISALEDMVTYPNPATTSFVIELNNGHEKMVEVSDVTGRTVLTRSSSNARMTLDISDLANGVYYVKVMSNSDHKVIKVVKD